jgi:hypothetical protein
VFLFRRAVFLFGRYTAREPCTVIGIPVKAIFLVHGSRAVYHFLIGIHALLLLLPSREVCQPGAIGLQVFRRFDYNLCVGDGLKDRFRTEVVAPIF